ncbi:MAG: class I SAM-dependent methyltransferase [Thermoleophilia bacterium]|nr:class I SAM-dependent methyltransferase [Thermoleophilia bacterium]
MNLRVRLFAALYDRMAAASEQAGLADERRRLLAGARGRVLEVGAGTGLNLEHYPDGVEELVLTEPEEPMRRRLEERVTQTGRPATVVAAPAERLPFRDASFETVVATLVLCSVDDPAQALRELRRVLRPGGSLLFLEHVRADDPGLAGWQDRLAKPWRFVACGCRCNQPTVALVEAAPFRMEELERGELPKSPALTRPLARGRAVAA